MELHFDVVGAEGPKRYFDGLTRETLAHAYLFSGPAGVGKKVLRAPARAVAALPRAQRPRSRLRRRLLVVRALSRQRAPSRLLRTRRHAQNWSSRCAARLLPRRRTLDPGSRPSAFASVVQRRDARLASRRCGLRDARGGQRAAQVLEEPPKGVVMLLQRRRRAVCCRRFGRAPWKFGSLRFPNRRSARFWSTCTTATRMPNSERRLAAEA